MTLQTIFSKPNQSPLKLFAKIIILTPLLSEIVTFAQFLHIMCLQNSYVYFLRIRNCQFCCLSLWEHVKKHLHSQRTRPQSIKKNKKCSETKVYTKIFREIFARVSVKNIKTFQKYFLKNIEIFLQNQSFFRLFQAFLVSKTYIFIHVKKTKQCPSSVRLSVRA